MQASGGDFDIDKLTSFNLVIEMLFNASGSVASQSVYPPQSFNLVIEMLFNASQTAWFAWTNEQAERFNLVIEMLFNASA